jgi:hypothetical protein
MTTPDDRDPVSGWATEHYGFDDETQPSPDQVAASAPASTSSSASARSQPRDVPSRPRRRALVAAAVLSLGLAAGVGGGIAVAGVTADGDQGSAAIRADDDVAFRFDQHPGDHRVDRAAGRP